MDTLDDPALAGRDDGGASIPVGHLAVSVDKAGARIGEGLVGLSLEEINHSLDGGLYAELLQNRDMTQQAAMLRNQKPVRLPADWWPVNSGGLKGEATSDEAALIPKTASLRSLRLEITGSGEGWAGVENDGYWGIPVRPGGRYGASFYEKAGIGFVGPVNLSIGSKDGKKNFAEGRVEKVTESWQRYEVEMEVGKDVPASLENRFVISGGTAGTLWLNYVSLFPPTYGNRRNGNRIDLMEKLAALKPAFIVFPGGDTLGGPVPQNRFPWKVAIGPMENRMARYSTWHFTSNGFGLLEFLETCEELKAKPVLATYSGTSMRGSIAPGKDLEPYVQSALDEIEYVTGDKSTTWGARRAADGHPEAFPLEYVRIGNNEQIFNKETYDERFTQFYDAIKKKYPAIKVIGWMNLATTRTPDVVHESFYNSAHDLLADSEHYEDYPRSGPKFETEFNAKEGDPTKTLKAALADFSWLLDVQRNADAVVMAAPAPVFINLGGGAAQHPAALIGYDALSSFASPSYYGLRMFNENKGDRVVRVKLTAPAVEGNGSTTAHGAIGVGAWGSDVEYKDIQVSKEDGTVLFQSDFSKGTDGWRFGAGTWGVHEGALRQSSDVIGCTAIAGDPSWTDYKLTMKAKKNKGNEGFLIMVHAADDGNFVWWNLGGWSNTRTAIEQTLDGGKIALTDLLPNAVNFGQWYDIEVDVHGSQIVCLLDGKPVLTGTERSPKPPTDPLFAAASRDEKSGDVILKVVNVTGTAMPVEISLDGIAGVEGTGELEVMAGEAGDVNTLNAPEKIVPRRTTVRIPAKAFTHRFPAYSASVLRVRVK